MQVLQHRRTWARMGAVKDVSAGVAAYAQRYPGVQFAMVAVTNQRFNNTAKHQAKVLNVELIEGDDLVRLVEQHPMKRWELEQFHLAGWGANNQGLAKRRCDRSIP